MAMVSTLIVLFLLAPLILGVAFAVNYRRRLRKPAWSCLAVVAEGYVLALLISIAFGGSVLPKIGLSGTPSQVDSQFGQLETSAALALVTLIVPNIALLWWNLRILTKRA